MTINKVTIGNCTLYNADCRDVLPELGRFDLLLTDPPYGIGAHTGIGKYGVAREQRSEKSGWTDDAPPPPDLLNALRTRCSLQIVFGANYFQLPPSRGWLVWDKGAGFKNRTFAEAELVWTNIDMNTKIFAHDPLAFRDYINKDHPTQKPIRLMQFCIHQADKQSHNATIFDPFMGSGSTAMACILEGRTFTGIEREPRYFDAACKRIERANAQGRLFTDT